MSTASAVPSFLDAALSYAARGWRVFPCHAPTPAGGCSCRQDCGRIGKHPRTQNGLKDASMDHATIRQWWRQWPQANIAIATGAVSRLIVLDEDSYKGGDQSRIELERSYGLLPETIQQLTGGGGIQHLFAHPGMRVKNGVETFGVGLDIRGDGGYIIVPPSLHASGKQYAWEVAHHPDDVALAPMPTWLLALCQEATRREAPSAGELIPHGRRNQTLFQLGCGFRARGCTEAVILAALREMNATQCQPPLDDAEVATITASCAKYEAGPAREEARQRHEGQATTGTQGPVVIDQARDATLADVADWPEPLTLPEGLPTVLPFDFALLPETLRPWAQDICERVQCPPDFVGVTVMAALSAVLGRKVGIRPQVFTDWTVIANQWALAIGRPGVLKSPAMEAALAPVKRLQACAVKAYDAAFTDYRQVNKLAKLRLEAGEKAARKKLERNPQADVSADLAVEEPTEPQMLRYLANDTTAAALGELLRQNPSGLLIFRDEIVSLLKSLDREDQAEARGFYLTAWNGDSGYIFDRIGRGLHLHIPAVCLCMLGSSQPGRIAEYLRHAVRGGEEDDGLIQRFGLLVWPDTNGSWREVDRWPDSAARRTAFQAFDYIGQLTPDDLGAQCDEDDAIPYLRFDAAALEVFRTWREGLETLLRSEKLHPALESHFAKYRKLVPGLALLCHVADWQTSAVGIDATLRALSWAEYLDTHARRAYASVMHADLKAAHVILDKLRRGELPHALAARDIYRQGWAHLSNRTQVTEALQLLVDHDYLAALTLNTAGRPKHIYQVNPKGLL
jgi:hypothetical protein